MSTYCILLDYTTPEGEVVSMGSDEACFSALFGRHQGLSEATTITFWPVFGYTKWSIQPFITMLKHYIPDAIIGDDVHEFRKHGITLNMNMPLVRLMNILRLVRIVSEQPAAVDEACARSGDTPQEVLATLLFQPFITPKGSHIDPRDATNGAHNLDYSHRFSSSLYPNLLKGIESILLNRRGDSFKQRIDKRGSNQEWISQKEYDAGLDNPYNNPDVDEYHVNFAEKIGGTIESGMMKIGPHNIRARLPLIYFGLDNDPIRKMQSRTTNRMPPTDLFDDF